MTEHDQWEVTVLGRLVAAAKHGRIIPKLSQQAMIKLGAKRVGGGTLAGLGKLIGKAKNTVWTWANTDAVMPLPDILNLCYVLQVDLLEFICGQPECWDHINGSPKGTARSSKRASVTQLDLLKIERHLVAQNSSSRSAPSVAAVARELDLPERTLRLHFPDLCREIRADFNLIEGITAVLEPTPRISRGDGINRCGQRSIQVRRRSRFCPPQIRFQL